MLLPTNPGIEHGRTTAGVPIEALLGEPNQPPRDPNIFGSLARAAFCLIKQVFSQNPDKAPKPPIDMTGNLPRNFPGRDHTNAFTMDTPDSWGSTRRT